jgi:hypothetical protein
MGRLVKIGFPCNTLAVHPSSRPYVHCDTSSRTSTVTLRAVRPVMRQYIRSEVFQGEPHFLPTVRLFSNS